MTLKLHKLIKAVEKTDIFDTFLHAKNYFSASFAQKALAVITLPIFTRLFTRADYGIVSVFQANLGILTILISLNSFASVGRYYYENKDDYREFLGTTFSLVGLILLLLIPLYLIFYGNMIELTDLPGLLPLYLLIICIFEIVMKIYIQILIPRKKSREYALINVIRGYSAVGLAIILVMSLSSDRYRGQIWSKLIIGALVTGYILYKIIPLARFTFNWKHIKFIGSYSIPLMPYALSGVILSQFDRIMINKSIGEESAGLYSLGYNVGMIIVMVITATTSAHTPDFYKFMNNREYCRLDALVRKIFSFYCLSALGLILFAKEIVFFLADKKFHPGLIVVPWVVIGYIFYGMFTVYGRYFGFLKKTYFNSINVLASGILNIVLNAIYIPKYGYVAGAYTTAISYAVMFLLTWLVARFILKVRIVPLWIIIRPCLILGFFLGINYVLTFLTINIAISIILKIMIILISIIFLFSKEINEFRNKI